jgi:hypothetical protein
MNILRCLSTFILARLSSDSTFSRYSRHSRSSTISTISTYSSCSIFKNESSQSITNHKNFAAPVHEVLCVMFFSAPLEPQTSCKTMSNEFTYAIAGGYITCNQCQAMSKRSRQRCKAPSMKDKAVCRTHGGRSTGPKTEAGRQRCAEAKTIHGRETREARTERSLGSARLALLETIGFSIELFKGNRTRGRKPKCFSSLTIEK